jgi:hypothetical protein
MSFLHYIGRSKQENCRIIRWKENFSVSSSSLIPINSLYYEITSFFKDNKFVKQIFIQKAGKPE